MNKTNPKSVKEGPRLPTELRKAFADAPKAKAKWSDLTPIARRNFISWTDSAKESEVHKRRTAKACVMLAPENDALMFQF